AAPVDLARAAPFAHRLQPGRAVDRADGARGARVAYADQRQSRRARPGREGRRFVTLAARARRPRFTVDGRNVRPLALAMLLALAPVALAGPVFVYREGAGWCPHDRDPAAPRITAQQAVERARTLLPKDFCGPSWYVDGCDF